MSRESIEYDFKTWRSEYIRIHQYIPGQLDAYMEGRQSAFKEAHQFVISKSFEKDLANDVLKLGKGNIMKTMKEIFLNSKLNEGLVDEDEELLLELLDNIRTMKTELNETKIIINHYLEYSEIPVNHNLKLSDEFIKAQNEYNKVLEEI